MLELTLHNPVQAHAALQQQVWPAIKGRLLGDPGCKLVLRIDVAQDARTLRQNAYYFGVVLREVADQARINGVGATVDGWHRFFKLQYLGYRFTKIKMPGKKRPSVVRELRSTTTLKVRGFGTYIEKVTAQAVTDFGVMFSCPTWQEYRAGESFGNTIEGQIDPDTGEIL